MRKYATYSMAVCI